MLRSFRLLCPGLEMTCPGTTQSSTESDKWRQLEEDYFKSNSHKRLWTSRSSRDTVNSRPGQYESSPSVGWQRPFLGHFESPLWIRGKNTAVLPPSTASTDGLHRASDFGHLPNEPKGRTASCPSGRRTAHYLPDVAHNRRPAIMKQAPATGR